MKCLPMTSLKYWGPLEKQALSFQINQDSKYDHELPMEQKQQQLKLVFWCSKAKRQTVSNDFVHFYFLIYFMHFYHLFQLSYALSTAIFDLPVLLYNQTFVIQAANVVAALSFEQIFLLSQLWGVKRHLLSITAAMEPPILPKMQVKKSDSAKQ